MKHIEIRTSGMISSCMQPHIQAQTTQLSQKIFRPDPDNQLSCRLHFNPNHDAHIYATPTGSIASTQGIRRTLPKNSLPPASRIPTPNDNVDTAEPATTLRCSITTHNVQTGQAEKGAGACPRQLQRSRRARQHAGAVDVGRRLHVRWVWPQQRHHNHRRRRRVACRRRGLYVAAVGDYGRDAPAQRQRAV